MWMLSHFGYLIALRRFTMFSDKTDKAFTTVR